MKPLDAIKQTLVEQGFSQPAKEYEEKLLDIGTKVRYLCEPGELEGYQYKGERRKRSTDPIWSVDLYKIKDRYVQKHQPTLNTYRTAVSPTLDLLCHEDFNVGRSEAESNIEIFMAQ